VAFVPSYFVSSVHKQPRNNYPKGHTMFAQAKPTENMKADELAATLATMSPDACLKAWLDSKELLAKVTAFESALRAHNVAVRFPNLKASGTQNCELGNDYKLKCVTKTNYNLGNAEVVEKALKKIESKLGPDLGGDLARRLVSWKPSLSLTEYKALAAPIKAIIDTVLTTSDGKPTLELIEPPAAK